jgi:hypothetical protein
VGGLWGEVAHIRMLQRRHGRDAIERVEDKQLLQQVRSDDANGRYQLL